MKRSWFLFVLLVGLLSLSLTGAAFAQGGDSIVLAFSRQPDSLFADYAQTSTAGFAMRVLYNSLVKLDGGEFVGDLAESWEVSEDQLTWTFHLRPGVTWHDGEPLTANDVAFSFTFPADPNYNGLSTPVALAIKGAQEYHDGTATSIEGIQVIDDSTVALTTTTPSALFLSQQGARYIYPQHVFEGVAVADFPTSAQAHQPIGTGPYKLISWTSDQSIVYERFDDFYGDKAKIKNYTWVIIPEQTVQITELLAGNVGIVPEVLADDFTTLVGDPAVKTLQLPGVNFTMLMLNETKPLFSDVRVRQAINYAINKQSIIDAIGGGFGTAVTSIVHPSLPEYNPNLVGFPFDPERAKALLAEAGWTDDDGDGIVEAHGVAGVDDGTPLSFELGTINRPLYQSTNQIVQQDLKAVGIDVQLNVVDFNTYFSEYLTGTSDYTAAVSGWFAFELIPQGELETNFAAGAAQNWVHWASNDEFEGILDTAPSEFDAAKRNALYWRAQEILEENAVWVNLARLDNLIAYSANLSVPEVGSLSALFSSVPQWEWVQ